MLKPLDVRSEIHRLSQVMVHHPREELEMVSPFNFETLLFDDILFLETTQQEHRLMERTFQALGVDVVRTESALSAALPDELGSPLHWSDALPRADRWDIERIIWEVVAQQRQYFSLEQRRRYSWLDRYFDEMQHYLRGVWQAHGRDAFARALIEGTPALDTMGSAWDAEGAYLVSPLPNMLFARDPAIVVQDRVIISSMANLARARESLLTAIIFRHNAVEQGNIASPFWFDPYTNFDDRRDGRWIKVEGGDVLVVHNNILAIGLSERTTKGMLHTLAQRFMMDTPGPEVVYAVIMPKERSVMHLDTIFTFINHEECLLYAPMILRTGLRQVQVLRLSQEGDSVRIDEVSSLLEGLQDDLRHFTGQGDLSLNYVLCGGDQPIQQDREQWSDGANAFALAPGVIVLYDRNIFTLEALSQAGYTGVRGQDIVGDAALAARIRAAMERGDGSEKYAITIPSTELSRARGGPRCMTMPIQRIAPPSSYHR